MLQICIKFVISVKYRDLLKFNQDGRGGETREFVCQSIPKIEKFLAFGQDLHRRKAGTGFANCRLHTKKGQQCMSVVMEIKSVHYKRPACATRAFPREHAKWEVSVGTMVFPVATCGFSKSFTVSEENKEQLKRYMRTLPARMQVDGYSIDNQML